MRRILCLLLAVIFILSSAPTANAQFVVPATFSEADVESILDIIRAFNADTSVVNNVSTILRGRIVSGASSSPTSPITTSPTDSRLVPPSTISNQSTAATTPSCHSFNYDLSVGSTGDEVLALRNTLAQVGFITSARNNPGFDDELRAAVARFQMYFQISPTGYVGPVTRTKLSSLGCGSGSISHAAPSSHPPVQSSPSTPVQPSSENAAFSYGQSVSAFGISIKAPNQVDRAALQKAKEIVEEMLKNIRPDVVSRMVGNGASIAIVPKDSFITVLAEYKQFSGKTDRNGNAYDSLSIRGSGGVIGQPVTVVSEENLLKLPGDPFWQESVTHHEFAHAIMNLGFSPEDRQEWLRVYAHAKEKNTFPGMFAMVHEDEYWAELSQSYFHVNNEIGGRNTISAGDPTAYAFLQSIYTSN